jgi:hypothetical protein
VYFRRLVRLPVNGFLEQHAHASTPASSRAR